MVDPGDGNGRVRAYRPAPFYMVRAALSPIETIAPLVHGDDPTTGPAGAPGRRGEPGRREPCRREEGHREEGHRHLRELARDTRFYQGLHTASPSVAAAAARLIEGRLIEGRQTAKETERAYSSLLRYGVRMSTRATPYGLFAGVGIGTFGPATSLSLACDPVLRTRTRADAAWLMSLLHRIEADEAARHGLPVRPNALLHRWSDRAVVLKSHGAADEPDEEISVRLTGPANAAIDYAQAAVTFGELASSLRELFPAAGGAKVNRLLAQMWESGILLNGIMPPPTVAVPEQWLIVRLGDDSRYAEIVEGLRRTRALAGAVDSARGRADRQALDRLTRHQRAMTPGFRGPTYQTDTALAVAGTALSTEVARLAAEAGELLTRLWPNHSSRAHLASYHAAFMERYGVASEIPLLEVLSPESGLGPPNTYQVPPRLGTLPQASDRDDPARDQALVSLAAEALRRGLREVELTDERIEALTPKVEGAARPAPRPSLDIYFQIAARSTEDVDRGRWRMVLSSGMFDGLRTFGRFFDLFSDDDLARIQEFAEAEAALDPDVVKAELTYPRPGMMGNLAIHPPLRRYEICVNTQPALPPGRQIPLADILVGATTSRFYLRSASTGRQIRVTQTHALSIGRAPNVCRALVELSNDGLGPLGYFDWGPMASAPSLPRVARGKLVLAPAQWTLQPEQLGAGDGGAPERGRDGIYGAVRRWREELSVPRHVYLTDRDNRLLLDLDNPLFVDELGREARKRARQGRGGPLRLHEMLPDFDEHWLRDGRGGRYSSEFVIPLLATRGPAAAAAGRSPATTARPVPRRYLPGQEWVYLKLYAAPAQQEQLLTGPLGQLLASVRDDIDRWFYIRYVDPLPHLRLRLHATGRGVNPVMAGCAQWAAALVEAGLASDFSFATYHRELERYGGPAAIDAIEAVFCANSQASLGLLAYLRDHPDAPEDETVCVLAWHLLHESWGIDPFAAAAGRATSEISEQARKRFRAIRQPLCELLTADGRYGDPRAIAHTHALREILSGQHHTVAEAARLVDQRTPAGHLPASPRSILESLAHMQANRLLGPGREREQRCHDLWFLAARAITGRRRARMPAIA